MNPSITILPSSTVMNANKESATLSYSFHRSIDEIAGEWDAAAPAHDIFLQSNFLAAVEAYPPLGMRFVYLIFYKNADPVGVALCQIKYFKGDDNIAELDKPQKDPCFFNGLAAWFKKWVAGKAAADILICGNMLLTGEHGFYFNPRKIEQKEAITLLGKALDQVVERMGQEGIKMPVILVKDIAPEQKVQRSYFPKNGYTEFEIQPNMILKLPYSSFDEYLAAMSTKYRTRVKRAIKKLDGIQKVELSEADVERELSTIYSLYRDIAKNAGFNMVDLNETYLLGLKQRMVNQFRVFAYYHQDRLVAFYSTIQNHQELEAHFLGFDKALNHDYQLYLNILYDIVRIGIDSRCEEIVFARTALEIKSSVGATAHELWCYLRHQNPIANKFAGTILDYLKPVEEWVPRHPFKEDSAHESNDN
jgi:predicted N-acyltransferase